MKSWFKLENVIKVLAIGFFSAALFLPMRKQKIVDLNRFELIAGALEAYAVDNGGEFPPEIPSLQLPNSLTTPIPYLQPDVVNDPLSTAEVPNNRFGYRNFLSRYMAQPGVAMFKTWYDVHGAWMILSCGYDRTFNVNGFNYYDPSNGTISTGDIIRSQRMKFETGMTDQ